MNTISIDTQRDRAAKFSKQFETASYEMGQAQRFVTDFCEIFGIDHRRLLDFETRVKKSGGKRGRIDAFIPSLLLVEMKSAGEDLDKAYTQATEYFHGLKNEELPRSVLVSDFQNLHLYNLETHAQPVKIKLADLAQKIDHFQFLAGYERIAIENQQKIICKTIDLFAGIGGIRLGFESQGCENVFSSEWDKDAQKMYEANFGEKPHGDINLIEPNVIPDHDILLAGFPCHPFSIAGKGLGFADTRGTLFFNIEKILETKKPRAFLLENVKRITTHDNGQTFAVILEKLKGLGYTVYSKVFNSLDFGLPQKRERIYIVGFLQPVHFDFPKPLGYYKPLNELLENDDDIAPSYFLSETIKQKRLNGVKGSPPFPSIWHENIGGNISALPYSCALRAGGSYNYLVVNGVRRLTDREMLRLQGFPDDFKINLPYSALRKVAGNSVSVPVIKAIAGEMIKALEMQQTVKPEPKQLHLI